MDEGQLAREFEEHRPRMLAVATRVLGSRSEAEDAVQEAWFRASRHAGEGFENFGAWLTRVVGRICIDGLRARAVRAESGFDSWESVAVASAADGPEDLAAQADAVSLAMVVVLESLKPEERLALVLHDVFAVPFAQIAGIVDRSEDAAKMLASRARRKVRAHPAPSGDRRERQEVADAFLAAAREGDFEALLRVLDPRVEWHHSTPHGRLVRLGAGEVLEQLRGAKTDRVDIRRVSVNGQPGFLAWGPSGRPIALMACTIRAGRIVRMDSLTDAVRLARLNLPTRESLG